MTHLYLLERKDQEKIDHKPWEEQIACVVAECSPRAARKVAQNNCGAEDSEDGIFWMSPKTVKCSVLAIDVKRKPGMVVSENYGA